MKRTKSHATAILMCRFGFPSFFGMISCPTISHITVFFVVLFTQNHNFSIFIQFQLLEIQSQTLSADGCEWKCQNVTLSKVLNLTPQQVRLILK